MRESLKRELDETVPKDVTLSEAKKRQILRAAQNYDGGRKPSKAPKFVPAFVGVAMIGLVGILGYPYVSDWQEERGAVEEAVPESQLQKLVVPGHEYDVLIRSIYNEYSGELILNDNEKIYAYDPEKNEETILVDLDEGTRSFQFDTEGKWLAWEEFSDEEALLKIMNLETEEVETIEDIAVMDLLIEGDRLVYGRMGGEDTPSYHSVDLNTMEIVTVHEMAGNEMGPAVIGENMLGIPDLESEEDPRSSGFFIYNLEDNALIKRIASPYPYETNSMVINNNRIYMEFYSEDRADFFLGYIDIESEEVMEIPAPKSWEFAVYGDYLAVSEMIDEDSTDLHLYKMSGNELEEMPAFSEIDERLVRPRFTEEGTLVVNGEGDDLGMYLLDLAD